MRLTRSLALSAAILAAGGMAAGCGSSVKNRDWQSVAQTEYCKASRPGRVRASSPTSVAQPERLVLAQPDRQGQHPSTGQRNASSQRRGHRRFYRHTLAGAVPRRQLPPPAIPPMAVGAARKPRSSSARSTVDRPRAQATAPLPPAPGGGPASSTRTPRARRMHDMMSAAETPGALAAAPMRALDGPTSQRRGGRPRAGVLYATASRLPPTRRAEPGPPIRLAVAAGGAARPWRSAASDRHQPAAGRGWSVADWPPSRHPPAHFERQTSGYRIGLAPPSRDPGRQDGTAR